MARVFTRSPAVARMADRTAPVVKLTLTPILLGPWVRRRLGTSRQPNPIMKQNDAYWDIFYTLKTTSSFIFILPVVWSELETNRKQEAKLNARGGRPYCPQSYKYNHAVRIWEVDAVGRQKIVIPLRIGLAAVLAVGQLSWSVKLCLSLYGKL